MQVTHNKYTDATTYIIGEGIIQKVLLVSDQSDGQFSIFEDIVEPGIGVPRHIHHDQDETFTFMEGTFDVEIDGTMHRMQAGDTAIVPKGSAHAWKNVGSTTGRLRYMFTPALDIEHMFAAFDEAIRGGTLNDEKIAEIAQKYPNQEVVGPPM